MLKINLDLHMHIFSAYFSKVSEQVQVCLWMAEIFITKEEEITAPWLRHLFINHIFPKYVIILDCHK